MSLLAAVCAAVSVVLAMSRTPAMARLDRIVGPPRPEHGRRRSPVPGDRSGSPGRRPRLTMVSSSVRAATALVGGLGVVLVLGGGLGLVAGAAATIGAWIGLGRLEPAAAARERERAVAQVPLAAELLAAALSAGAPPATAAESVGTALGGPLGTRLAAAAYTARLGADPALAWSALAAEPGLRSLARALAGAAGRGTSPVAVLQRVAHDARDAARWAGEARARSLGARASAPLGLCFLPAFVLLGVVPVVATSGVLAL